MFHVFLSNIKVKMLHLYLNRIVVKIQDFTDLHRYFLWNCLNTGSRKMVSFPCNNAETKNRDDLNHTCRVVDPRNWVPNSKYCKTLQLLVCLIKPLFLVQVFSYGSFFFLLYICTYFCHNNGENKHFVRTAHHRIFEHFHRYCLHLHKQIVVITFNCAFQCIN